MEVPFGVNVAISANGHRAAISRYGSGSLKIRLRPLRLAFLVHEADEAAILTAMETCRSLQ